MSTKIRGKCSHKGCRRQAKAKHECLTCEKLVEAGKAEEVFVLCACSQHQADVLAKMKKHILTGHPVNILRGVVAQLKGEDVF